MLEQLKVYLIIIFISLPILSLLVLQLKKVKPIPFILFILIIYTLPLITIYIYSTYYTLSPETVVPDLVGKGSEEAGRKTRERH